MEKTENVHNSKKRKLSKVHEFHEFKKSKTEVNILNLPDCVLLEVFRFLQAFELIQISKTCIRFEYLIEEKCLWDVVNLKGDAKENDCNFVVDHLTQRTRKLLFTPKHELSFQIHWLFKINKLQNITVIILENQRFTKGTDDKVACVLLNFPPSLEVLSLKQSMMSLESGKYFFSHGEEKLTKLHTLLLDFCPWVQESALMVISKLPELRNLSMLGCQLVKDALSYTGLAGRYGFKKLQRLNVSYTGLADEFIKSFYCLSTLQELYMRNETKNYHIQLSDDSIRWYEHSAPIDPVQPLKDTEYFQCPYGPCKCSFGNSGIENEDDDEDDFSRNERRDIEDEKKLPLRSFYRYSVQDAGPSAPGQEHNVMEAHVPSCQRALPQDLEAEEEHPVNECRVVVDFGLVLGGNPLVGRRIRGFVGHELNNHMVVIGNPAKKNISLKVLTLRNFYKITDDSLQSLSHLPLTLLDVTGTGVTDTGVRNFLNLHPNCRVVHKSACRCPPKPL